MGWTSRSWGGWSSWLPPVQTVPLLFQGGCHVVQFETHLLGFHHEVLHFLFQQVASLGCSRQRSLRYHRAEAGAYLDQPFSYKVGDHLVRGVGIDLEGGAESAHRWKGVARPQLAGDDCLLGGVDDLLVERNSRLEREAERDHRCIITASTAKSREMQLEERITAIPGTCGVNQPGFPFLQNSKKA